MENGFSVSLSTLGEVYSHTSFHFQHFYLLPCQSLCQNKPKTICNTWLNMLEVLNTNYFQMSWKLSMRTKINDVIVLNEFIEYNGTKNPKCTLRHFVGFFAENLYKEVIRPKNRSMITVSRSNPLLLIWRHLKVQKWPI